MELSLSMYQYAIRHNYCSFASFSAAIINCLFMLRQLFTLRFLLATSRNPYDVLGLKPSATPDDIKKSYRTIAQKYHPDKNPDPIAQKTFIEAKQAYETLIDEDKRRQFDSEHTSSRSHGFDRNPFDEFKDDIYKDKTRPTHDSFTGGSSRRKRGDDITREVAVDFVEAVKGINIDISFDRKSTCPSCGGNKCKPGTAPTRCLSCGGSGSTVYRRGGIVMHLECERCKGVGQVIKNPCMECKASGIMSQRVTERITVPPGAENGQNLTIPQKGDQSQNGPSGDLIIKLVVSKHPRFRKVGDDIHSTQWITISQAALGTNRLIETLWGQKNLTIPEGSQDGTPILLKSEGVQGLKGKGNHIATLRVKIPTRLNEKQRKIFQELSREEEPAREESGSRDKAGEQEGQSVFERMKKAFK